MSSTNPPVSDASDEPVDHVDTSGSPKPSDAPQTTRRIESVDTLRGLTILTMVFVNDAGPAAPAWSHHIQPPDADGMTLADVVFPAFLFIVGISIPLAIDRARRSGATLLQQLGHILVRTGVLLLMGLVQFNATSDTTLGKYWWALLAYVSMILAWCVVPSSGGAKGKTLWSLKGIGALSLVALLAIFRREPVATTIAFYGETPEWVWLQTGWWGILGLIGWAYLIASLTYLALGHRREWLMGAMAILLTVYVANRSGGLLSHLDSKTWLSGVRPLIDPVANAITNLGNYVDIGGALGSLPSISVAGCLLGTILLPTGGVTSHSARIRWALIFAIGLFIAGVVADTFAGINKIASTPTWCLWSAAVTTIAWAVLYLIMDVRGIRSWSLIVRPAGANPLIAYLLHPIVIWIVALTGMSAVVAYKSSDSSGVAMLGSLVMAFAVCGLTGLIARAGLRMRV